MNQYVSWYSYIVFIIFIFESNNNAIHNSNNAINNNKIITEVYYPHILAITFKLTFLFLDHPVYGEGGKRGGAV